MNLGTIAYTPNALATGVHMGSARWQFTGVFDANGFNMRSFDLVLWHRLPDCEQFYRASQAVTESRLADPHVHLYLERTHAPDSQAG